MDDRRGPASDAEHEQAAASGDRADGEAGREVDAGRDADAGSDADAGWDGPREPDADRDGERVDRADRADGEDDAAGSTVEGVFGARPDDVPQPNIGPETPSLENATFVVLGVLFALFVIYRTIAVLPT